MIPGVVVDAVVVDVVLLPVKRTIYQNHNYKVHWKPHN